MQGTKGVFFDEIKQLPLPSYAEIDPSDWLFTHASLFLWK